MTWPRLLGISALWVAIAAVITAYLIYRNSEAVGIMTMLGNICLPLVAGCMDSADAGASAASAPPTPPTPAAAPGVPAGRRARGEQASEYPRLNSLK